MEGDKEQRTVKGELKEEDLCQVWAALLVGNTHRAKFFTLHRSFKHVNFLFLENNFEPNQTKHFYRSL